MRVERNARSVGVLVLFHLAVGLMIPFMMLHVIVGAQGFLTTASGNAGLVRGAVLLLGIGSAIPIAMSLVGMPMFRRHSETTAYWLVALAIAGFTLQMVDNGRLLSMLSLSNEYARAGAGKTELFESLAVVVGSARKWAHYTYLLVAVIWMLVFSTALYRFRLVPRALAAFTMIGCLLQIAGVTLPSLLGYPMETRLAMPLAPAYAGVALWLIFKGIGSREPALEAATVAGAARIS